eukprot:GILJ01014764.1.p1 GENE.GILJ01014764.1~~GILJ01014764.1.p1  ORF type:complete len:579 (+),score=48.57 GILJ01014764.1:417-2153(+)
MEDDSERHPKRSRFTLSDTASTSPLPPSALLLRERADCVVSELLDAALIGEGLLPSLRHAKQCLMKPNFRSVPASGSIFAQVVESVSLWHMHRLRTTVTGSLKCNLCPGAAGLEHINLGPLKRSGLYRPLTDPFEVFHFDFCNLPEATHRSRSFDCRTIESGEAHAIIIWFEVWMDEAKSIKLSTAVGSSPPRDHWRQCVFFLPQILSVSMNSTVSITAVHDDDSVWFGVESTQDASIPRPINKTIEPPICLCGLHVSHSRSHIALLNDEVFTQAWNNGLQATLARLSDNYKPRIKVFDASESFWIPLLLRPFPCDVLVRKDDHARSELCSMILASDVGPDCESTFQFIDQDADTDSGYDVNLIISDCIYESLGNVWVEQHIIYHWYQKAVIGSSCESIPYRADLRACLIEAPDLWRVHTPVQLVEGIDMSALNAYYTRSVSSVRIWDHQFKTVSSPVTLLTYDLSQPVHSVSNIVTMCAEEVSGTVHGLLLWIDVYISPEHIIYTGLLNDDSSTGCASLLTAPYARWYLQGFLPLDSPAVDHSSPSGSGCITSTKRFDVSASFQDGDSETNISCVVS